MLFAPASADLADDGKAQIAGVAGKLQEVLNKIPNDMAWSRRVDRHTNNRPLAGNEQCHDNLELSQAQAPAVVR